MPKLLIFTMDFFYYHPKLLLITYYQQLKTFVSCMFFQGGNWRKKGLKHMHESTWYSVISRYLTEYGKELATTCLPVTIYCFSKILYICSLHKYIGHGFLCNSALCPGLCNSVAPVVSLYEIFLTILQFTNYTGFHSNKQVKIIRNY